MGPVGAAVKLWLLTHSEKALNTKTAIGGFRLDKGPAALAPSSAPPTMDLDVEALVARHGDSAAAAALLLAATYALIYVLAAALPAAACEGYVLEWDCAPLPRYSRRRRYRLNGLRVLAAAGLVFAAAANVRALPADYFARHFYAAWATACALGLAVEQDEYGSVGYSHSHSALGAALLPAQGDVLGQVLMGLGIAASDADIDGLRANLVRAQAAHDSAMGAAGAGLDGNGAPAGISFFVFASVMAALRA